MRTTDPVRALIHDVRARVTRSRFLRGVSLVIAAVCGALLVSFALDRVLDLPVAVRAVHLAVFVVATVLFARWSLRPSRVRPSDESVAQAIEIEVPEFQDRLVSALDFERRVGDPHEPESREMMAASIRDAEAIASRIDAHLLVDSRPARRGLMLAAAALAAVLVVEFLFPTEFQLWLQRAFLLADVPWPRRTTILVEGFPAEGPLVITRGDDLRIVARAEGAQPPDLTLHLEELEVEEDGTERVATSDDRKMYPVPEQSGRYSFEFRAVGASFRFWVDGGDDVDHRPVYAVKALVPPRVASFQARIEPPAYTNVPATVVTEPNFEALRGAKVTLTFTTNMPVASARLQPKEGAAETLTVGADGKSFGTSFELAATREFHVELRAAAGQKNRDEDDVFHIEAVADRAPTVRMLHPQTRILATPDAIVPVKLLAEDDFGVAEVSFEMRQGTAGAWSSRIWTPESADPPVTGPQKRATVYREVDLDVFKGDQGVQVKPSDVLALQARAKDAGGQETAGPEVSVEIVAAEDLAQRIQTEMQRLREDLGKSRTIQRRTVTGIRDLQTAGSPSSDAAAVRRVRDLQVDQGRVVNETSRFLTGCERVFDLLVLNRLGSRPTVDRLLPVYRQFLRAPADDAGEVFTQALYAKILEEKRANRLYDPELLGILLDVMDLSERLRESEGPAANDALERWGADATHAAAELADAQTKSATVLSTLDAIDERLQRFDDMSQILQLARTIRDRQRDLREKQQTPQEPEKK